MKQRGYPYYRPLTEPSGYFNTAFMARTQILMGAQNKHFRAGSQADLTRGLNSSVTQAIKFTVAFLRFCFSSTVFSKVTISNGCAQTTLGYSSKEVTPKVPQMSWIHIPSLLEMEAGKITKT